jgi:hypothetical protein
MTARVVPITIDLRKQKRLSGIAVGDLIQYRYSYGPKGFQHSGITTLAVTEVIGDGSEFVVEGGWHVFAASVIAHIPMHRESGGRTQEQEAAQ